MPGNRSALSQEQVERLVAEAKAGQRHAHAPYSRFPVGAALLTASGRVHRGCNVENASFGLTVCAERNALFGAVAAGERGFAGLAVVAPTEGPPLPCGACRQVLAEFCADDMPVVLDNGLGVRRMTTLGELFPEPFRLAGGR